MFVSKKIYEELDKLSKNFNNNYSIVVDFLFYIFDRFSYEEKRNILRACPLMRDDTKKNPKFDQEHKKGDYESIVEEIKVKINPLLEDRLVNLLLDCDKLETVSDSIEFLLFVCSLIDRDLFYDLIIQYSIESIQFSDFSYLSSTKPEAYEAPTPIHFTPTIPDKAPF